MVVAADSTAVTCRTRELDTGITNQTLSVARRNLVFGQS
jgi:hypothetical protein